MFWAKPGPVAPGAVEAERRHADQDGARVGGVDGVPAQPELVEHVRREVLDDDVDLLDEAAARAPRPAGDVRSMARSRLFGLTAWKNGLRSHH